MNASTAWAPQSQIETDESAGRALNGEVKEISTARIASVRNRRWSTLSILFSELNLEFI